MHKQRHEKRFERARAEFLKRVGREPDAFEERFLWVRCDRYDLDGDVPIHVIDWEEFRPGLRAWLRHRLPAALFKDVGDLWTKEQEEVDDEQGRVV